MKRKWWLLAALGAGLTAWIMRQRRGDQRAHAESAASERAAVQRHLPVTAQRLVKPSSPQPSAESPPSAEASLDESSAPTATAESAREADDDALSVARKLLGPRFRLDDLKVIEGVGPAIERMLIEGGVGTWRQLQDTPVERLRAILDGGGSRFRMHDPASWPHQAGLLADHQWEPFKRLTDELAAGRTKPK